MDQDRFDSLSAGERAVLRLAADHQNGEIARLLDISPETVKSRLAKVKLKLGGAARHASSRAFRDWEGHPPRVHSKRGISEPHPLPPPPSATLGRPYDGPPGGCAVAEVQERFHGFPPVEAPQPTRFDDEDAFRRLRFIGGAILRIAAGLLVMLAVAEMLQRLAVMNIGMFPNR